MKSRSAEHKCSEQKYSEQKYSEQKRLFYSFYSIPAKAAPMTGQSETHSIPASAAPMTVPNREFSGIIKFMSNIRFSVSNIAGA